LETSLSKQSTALLLTTKNNQTQHYIHPKHKTEKRGLANKRIYTLIWYAFYNLWWWNGAGPILTARAHMWLNGNWTNSECANTSLFSWLYNV